MTGRFSPTAIALILSLALNGLLAAYVLVSDVFAPDEDKEAQMLPIPVGDASISDVLNSLADRLPEEDAATLRAEIVAQSERLAEATEALRRMGPRVGVLLIEAEVDAEALRVEMLRAGEVRIQSGNVVIEVLAAALPRMSRETRFRIATVLGVE